MLHKTFSHPALEKLYNLLKPARPWETITETKHTRAEIHRHCNICRKHSDSPVLFEVSLPNSDNLRFRDEISLDLMIPYWNAVLHIIDTATTFLAATVLDAHGESYEQ